MSFFASGSVAELMDSAMSVSSECRRGLRLWQLVGLQTADGRDGLVADHVDVVVHAATPLSAFIKSDDAAPSSVDVLPVTTVPSAWVPV